MAKWKACGAKGVRYYEHDTRKHGIKKDRYFAIRYQFNGQRREEGLGWASEGWNEEKAAEERIALKKSQRKGEGPRTLAEKRAANDIEQARKESESLTLADFWEKDYIYQLKARLSKKSSWEKEVAHFEKRIKPVVGDKILNDITPEDVDRILDLMRAEELAPRTQQYAVGTLFRIWKLAAKRKLVKAGDNPAMGVEIAKVNNTRLRVLSPQELKDILEALSVIDPAAHDITLFCAFTGCRFSEAARLTWEHVDLTRATALFPETKNRDSREVYLVPELLSMFDRLKHGEVGEHVFLRKSGQPFKEAPRSFKTAADELGLNDNRSKRDRATFHSLRHTAATFAARRGVPVKDMQLLFGWKTPSMVFRYCKGDEKTQRRAMQGLAQSLTAEPAKVLPMVKKG